MERMEEMENLAKQTIRENKNTVSRLKEKLQQWLANGELTPEKRARFERDIAEIEKTIEEFELLLKEQSRT
jgi:hypothetical protein